MEFDHVHLGLGVLTAVSEPFLDRTIFFHLFHFFKWQLDPAKHSLLMFQTAFDEIAATRNSFWPFMVVDTAAFLPGFMFEPKTIKPTADGGKCQLVIADCAKSGFLSNIGGGGSFPLRLNAFGFQKHSSLPRKS
jgi:hypothetical protein